MPGIHPFRFLFALQSADARKTLVNFPFQEIWFLKNYLLPQIVLKLILNVTKKMVRQCQADDYIFVIFTTIPYNYSAKHSI
ncbi:MAG: hypothetical protein VR68_03385 [Peptococcaceae bacterium BRH_c4a]|nr:MAG: hypothetical protein VR68_03385 [Peptococcaceae bacterium BRH_c4a]